MRKYGFEVDKSAVMDVVEKPGRVDRRGGQFLALKSIDRGLALRVVYRMVNDNILVIRFCPVGGRGLTYRLRYDPESDVLSVVVSESGEISHAEEMGDMVVHLSREGVPLFLEVLNASENVALMVQALAKREVSA